MASKSQRPTLQRVQEEVQDLLLDLQAGTLDRITLESGLKRLQERLKAVAIHGHHFEPDSDDKDPGTGRGSDCK